MTQYFDDFSADSVGSPPSSSRWTAHGFSGTSGYKTGNVVDLGGGIHALRIVDNGWGNALVGYTRTELGTYAPGGSETIEIVAKFRLNTVPSYFTAQGGLCAGIRFGNYALTPKSPTTWWGTRDFVAGGDYLSGVTVFGRTCAMDTWYRARFRRESNAVFKSHVWLDTDADDGSWDQVSGPDTTYASGGLGPFSLVAYASVDFAFVGIGTSGDAAPTSAASSGGVPKIMQAHARRRRM